MSNEAVDNTCDERSPPFVNRRGYIDLPPSDTPAACAHFSESPSYTLPASAALGCDVQMDCEQTSSDFSKGADAEVNDTNAVLSGAEDSMTKGSNGLDHINYSPLMSPNLLALPDASSQDSHTYPGDSSSQEMEVNTINHLEYSPHMIDRKMPSLLG